MKKKKISTFLLVIIISTLVVIVISIFLFTCLKKETTFYQLLFEADKALITTIIIGGIAKVISNDIIKVKKNDEKLRKIGIYSIGEGKLDYIQTKIMFGGRGYEYPKELKFCFISGCVFLRDFSDYILNAMKNGCNIKILLADEKKSLDFLERTEVICTQFDDKGNPYHYDEQIVFTKSVIDEIRAKAQKEGYSGSIEIRQYIDEYRYAFRLGVYGEKEKCVMRLWANFQPLCKDAINLSLGVHGIFDMNYISENEQNSDSSSIVKCIDKSFDVLWDKYQDSRY